MVFGKRVFLPLLLAASLLLSVHGKKSHTEIAWRADVDFYNKNYAKALAAYQSLYEETQNPVDLPYLAVMYASVGDFDRSVDTWLHAFDGNPSPEPNVPNAQAITDPRIRRVVQSLVLRIERAQYVPPWYDYIGLRDMMRHVGRDDLAAGPGEEGRILLEAEVADHLAGLAGRGPDAAEAARIEVYRRENRPQYASKATQLYNEVQADEAAQTNSSNKSPSFFSSIVDAIANGLNASDSQQATPSIGTPNPNGPQSSQCLGWQGRKYNPPCHSCDPPNDGKAHRIMSWDPVSGQCKNDG